MGSLMTNLSSQALCSLAGVRMMFFLLSFACMSQLAPPLQQCRRSESMEDACSGSPLTASLAIQR